MSLQLLADLECISLYHDSANHWLYVDWQGDLTLPLVQHGCLAIAQHFLQGDYRQVLNDNTNVTSITPDVSPWLARDYLPYIVLGDVDQIAWVYSPGLSARCYTDLAVYALNSPVVAMFADMAMACSWLEHVRFKTPDASKNLDDTSLQRLTQLLQARTDAASLIEVMGHRGIHLRPTDLS